MALTIPNTFVTGAATSATTMNANFQAVVDWSNGNVGTESLSAPYATVMIPFCVPGTAIAAGAYKFRVKVPTSTTWVPVVFDYSADVIAATTTITFNLTADAVNSFTSDPVLTDTDDAVAKSTTGFAGVSTYPAGTTLVMTVTVANSTCDDISGYLTVKTLLRS